VVGFVEVLKHARKLSGFFQRLFRLAVQEQPHAIIFVDYGGFNRRLAHKIKQYVRARAGSFNNWNPRLIQLVSPQVWASREGRARQMARDLDLLLTIFPFEKIWYAERYPQFKVGYIGHPMLDRHPSSLENFPLRGATAGQAGTASPPAAGSLDAGKGTTALPAEACVPPPGPSLVLLPGSRRSELRRHFPVLLDAFLILRMAMPTLRATAVLPNESLSLMARLWVREHSPNAPLTIQVGGLEAALAGADVAIASTGTVTMECAWFGVPAVTLYKTSWAEYEIGKSVIKVKSLTMPNLLAGEAIFPEFIQDAAKPENLARAALELLLDEPRRARIQARLREIIASLGGPGASRRAAEAIFKLL
jgi:lipid-A-disaccharide synthase